MSFVFIIPRNMYGKSVGCCAIVYPTALHTVDSVNSEAQKHELITLMLSLLNLRRPCCKSSRHQMINISWIY